MSKLKNNKQIKPEIAIKGIAASPGIAIGPLFIYTEPILSPELRQIAEDKVREEQQRFHRAIEMSKQYLSRVHKETEQSYGKDFAEIIQIQISILEDQLFLDEVTQLIEDELVDAAFATYKIFRRKKEHFLNLSDEYFRDRAVDVHNLKKLILRNLLGKKIEVTIQDGMIVAAESLSPADTIRLHHKHILGFCTNVGGKNSHTAIVARSLGVPAVVGTEVITNVAKTGDQLILDGNDGIIIINPGQKTIETYEQKQQRFLIIGKGLLDMADEPAVTLDGKRIQVAANIEFVEELDNVLKSGAEGIGLYRTEGLFMGENGLPTEEEQFEKYLKIAEAVKPNKVIIRSLDIGGDKLLPDLVGIPERNPFLGWRAIRFCLDHKEIFLPQLKAILRSNVHGNLQILLPMVSSLEEVRQVKEVIKEAARVVKSEGKKINDKIDIGMMVEIPSAALMAENFTGEVDFFSIGTNDLTQYTLAVDRANEKISHLYNHFHPALIQLIKKVIDVGKVKNIPVSMCGEMAGDPVAIALLLGMGLEFFSASNMVIPEIKHVIRRVSMEQCRELYHKVENLNTATEIQQNCLDFYNATFSNNSNLTIGKHENIRN